MKKIIIAIVLISQALIAQGEIEAYSTTAKLPENKMIWPLPEFSSFKDGIQITAKFIESKPILTVNQGSWAEHTYLVRYEITKRDKDCSLKELSFIVIRRWPTKESGIKMKALAYHFREGTKDFILTKDDHVKHMDYFSIMTYTRN